MFARVNSLGLLGMEAYAVEVEADLSGGLPKFDVVGLPDTAVSESRDRVRAAMKNCGFDFPVSRITINLAPADVRKEGSIYDLPILVALLTATRQLTCDIGGMAFLGELSLSGEVRGINGTLSMTIKAKACGFKSIFVPKINAAESAVVAGIDVFPVRTVAELVGHLTGVSPIKKAEPVENAGPSAVEYLDFADVRGQSEARRAIEIAAGGGHNALLIGPPGSGKSMLARRIPSILPGMTFEESIETTQIHSVAGVLPPNVSLIKTRPFRAPHHTVSPPGLSGGGTIPRPGEISLAHNGVLFLDELPEFPRQAMEVLRQPMEDGRITISRVSGSLSYPCSVMLVAAMNPCPCGFFGHPTKRCTCPPGAAGRYLAKVSGPLLDRLDIHVDVPPVEYSRLSGKTGGEPSAAVRARVNAARQLQLERFDGSGISCNAKMTPALTRKYCALTAEADQMMKNAFDRLGLSARAYDKILKIARTIADMERAETIDSAHIAEAIQYRSLDRKYWGNA